MTLRLVQIAMNAQDDSAVGRFWAEALGWGVSSEEPGVTNVEPVGFAGLCRIRHRRAYADSGAMPIPGSRCSAGAAWAGSGWWKVSA